jgi:hypothetical protein
MVFLFCIGMYSTYLIKISSAEQVIYAFDSFTRTLSGSLGSADIGGSYTLSGTASDMNVNGSAITMNIPGTGTGFFRKAYLTGVSQTNVDIKIRTKIDKLPTTSGSTSYVYSYVIGRHQESNAEYRARLRTGSNSKFTVIGTLTTGVSGDTTIGSESSQVNYSDNSYIWLRMQLIGTNPTTINIKAWNDGTTEPELWNYTATDSTASLQTSGSVGFASRTDTLVTNTPIVVTADDYLVTNGVDPTFTVSGKVFDDTDGDGILDAGETGYAGASVGISTGGTTTTDSNGNYSFADVASGSYTITLTAPDGYSITTTNPANISVSTDTTQNFGIQLIPPPSPVTYATDTFTRALTGGFGSADIGGSYILSGTATDFNVTGSEGTMNIPGTSTGFFRKAYLTDITQADVDLRMKFKIDKLPQTSGSTSYVYSYLIGRHQNTNAEYRARLRMGSNNKYTVIASYTTGSESDNTLSSESAQQTYTPGTFIWLRMQLIGSSPTTIKVKAWNDGSNEPGAWNYTTTDNQAGLQSAGTLGFATRTDSLVTNTPVLNTIDDLSVTNGVEATYTLNGHVFIDSNQDGVFDSGESGYNGATITLSDTTVATTDATGLYVFEGLAAGEYTVTVTIPSGYQGTTSSNITFSIAENVTRNFGVTLIPNPPIGSCLIQDGPDITLSGLRTSAYSNRLLDPFTKIDARTATWNTTKNSPVIIGSPGSGLCWYGGIIRGLFDPSVMTWSDYHATSALKTDPGIDVKVENVRIDNYGDAIKLYQGTENFALKGLYVSDSHDDCVESDWLAGGSITDSLFEGCYTGFAARPRETDTTSDGSNNVWDIENSFMYIKDQDQVFRGISPGHSLIFKWDNSSEMRSPKIKLVNNIFRIDSNNFYDYPDPKWANIPPINTDGTPYELTECQDNIVVWLGSGAYPGTIQSTFDGHTCFSVTTDVSVWDTAVNTWKSNHGYILPEATPTPTPIVQAYTVYGSVYEDTNGNGTEDEDELGYPGATISLTGQGETTTDLAGDYSFQGLPAGSYTLTLTVPDGYSLTTANPLIIDIAGDVSKSFGIQLPITPTLPSINPNTFASSSPENCSYQSPGLKTPLLYGAITQAASLIQLYFTESDEPVDHYVLEYGTSPNTYTYGILDMGIAQRNQMTYIVQLLSPNTTYYFRVRGGNHCAVGGWSNEISAKTLPIISSNHLLITKPVLEPIPSSAFKDSIHSGQENLSKPIDTEEETNTKKYSVNIKILDDNQNPVNGAIVTVHSTVQERTTDTEGIAYFEDLEPGQHSVIVSYNGYTGEQTLNLTGDTAKFDLTIHIKPQLLTISPLAYTIIGVLLVIILGILLHLKKRK